MSPILRLPGSPFLISSYFLYLCPQIVKYLSTVLPCLLAADKLQEMVRPFTLRDLALVRRLSEQGICLHTVSALADDLHHLRDAFMSLVIGGKSPTLIYKSEERDTSGFIQLLLQEDPHHAHVLYLSPSLQDSGGSDSAWLSLLDEAVVEVGRLGIHSLVAEVEERGPELPILRQAGFAVYSRQDIWLYNSDSGSVQLADSAVQLLPYLSSDEWDTQILYANMVPRLVQVVEPVPPEMSGDCWVMRDDRGELSAFIHVHDGSAATWLRFFIHPSAEADAAEIVKVTLDNVIERKQKPVYCCVRRYEGWLPAALEKTGFSIWGSQAIMVKHTVHHKKRPEPQLAVNIENSGVPATSPIVRRQQ